MTTILHAADSADFLALVPALAGYTPRESLVILPFHESRSFGTMRLDLPESTASHPEYVRSAIDLVSRVSGTDGLAFVVYTDEELRHRAEGILLPQRRLVDELVDLAADIGLRIAGALCVTPVGWADYQNERPEWRALADIPPAPAVPGIGDVSGDQLSGAELPPVDLAEKERVARALHDLDDVLNREHAGIAAPRSSENPQAVAAAAALDDLPELFEGFLDRPQTSSPFAVAALLWCLKNPPLRDTALLQWATSLQGGRQALDAQVRFAQTRQEIPSALGDLLMGYGNRPDPDRLRIALHVVRHAAACAPRAARPGPLVLAAWLSWAVGKASHAAAYLDLADEIDPGYRMAEVVRSLVNALPLPAWAFRPQGC